jgi:hypothetical protein
MTWVPDGHVACPADGQEAAVKKAIVGSMVVAALLLGMSLGRAADGDEAVFTAKVSSADHEADEGYFSLGKDATVQARPGTDLYRFLSRQNGREVRITLTLVDGRQLSRLER